MLACAAIPHLKKCVLCSLKRAGAFIYDQTMNGDGHSTEREIELV